MARVLSILGFISYLIISGFGDNSFDPYLNAKYGALRAGVSSPATEFNGTTPHENFTVITNGCMCSKIYDPVCGNDNKSYYNLCQLQCEGGSNVTVVHQGNCIPF